MIHATRQTRLLGLAMLLAMLACPVVTRAAEPIQDRVTYLINTLLNAHHTDDREDAAEDLGKIGDPRAIPALEQAAAYDEKGCVRKEAHKALERIRAMPPVAVAAPAPVSRPAPVVATPPPPPPRPVIVAAPAPVYVAPPVVVAPAPVVVAAAPVVVRRVYYPAPVVVPAPVCRPAGAFFSFSFSSHHSRHH